MRSRPRLDLAAAGLALVALVLALALLTWGEGAIGWKTVLMFDLPPTLAAFLPLVAPPSRRHVARIVAMGALWLVCFIGGFTVAAYFWPAAVVMTIAVTRGQDPQHSTP
jgi:hypothetical protein